MFTMLTAGPGACMTEGEFGEELAFGALPDRDPDAGRQWPLATESNARAACPLEDPFECDPREPSTCLRGEGCYPVEDGFVCAPSGGQTAGGPCQFQNECVPGLACLVGSFVPGCSSEGCCSSFCGASSSCLHGQECEPWFDEAPSACWAKLEVCVDLP